ncbi:energy-coupling factor ABC transporter permease [Brevibacillus ginsengisoli]|uniref:energy-coupling factor ABC transporter permease n=1 Tax=Brevibacillus ginsengisoli TaxID=363854 RepID=UPI003CE95DB0
MHIPDGILSPAVLGTTAVITAGVLAKSVRFSKGELEQRAVPVMGVMASFIFAAQMINFPLLGAAASGHLIGGALATFLFGFWPATLIMTTVIAIQALVFQDGGITALGTNLLNMAIIAPAAAAILFHLLRKFRLPRSVVVFVGAWGSVVLTALAGAVELALSGVVSLELASKALLFWHFFIGLGEGLITALVVPFALRSSFMIRRKEMTLE